VLERQECIAATVVVEQIVRRDELGWAVSGQYQPVPALLPSRKQD
jgi:hypothetical protein